MQNQNIVAVLTKVANEYPSELIQPQLEDVPRMSFNIAAAIDSALPKPVSEISICDLGGGVGLFSVGCAAVGVKRSVLVDDFDDSVNHEIGGSVLDLHKSYGVEVIERDVVSKGIDDIEGSFDVITTFDSMEHWHDSPKKLFQGVFRKLNRGGAFVLGVPNCVNLRKRITVPFGVGKWSSMEEWYDLDKFRGHVREPDVGDLVFIAKDMGLVDVKVVGRNWMGHRSPNSLIKLATKIADIPLRMRPQLCSDLYMIGRKP